VRMANLFLGICCSISALILLGGWYVSRSWLEAMNSLTVLNQQTELSRQQEEKLSAMREALTLWDKKMLEREEKLAQDLQVLQDEKLELDKREVDMEKVFSSLSRTRAEIEHMSQVPDLRAYHFPFPHRGGSPRNAEGLNL